MTVRPLGCQAKLNRSAAGDIKKRGGCCVRRAFVQVTDNAIQRHRLLKLTGFLSCAVCRTDSSFVGLRLIHQGAINGHADRAKIRRLCSCRVNPLVEVAQDLFVLLDKAPSKCCAMLWELGRFDFKLHLRRVARGLSTSQPNRDREISS